MTSVEKMKILIVDDKPENLLALESLLRMPDVEFHKAASGHEALDLLLTHEFALAMLDVQMPDMDGFELAELMRGTELTRAVPIIFVTAGAHDRMSTFRGYEKGAVDFLHKPLDPHIVKGKVLIFLELARQKQLLRKQVADMESLLKERDSALDEAREALRTRDEFMSIASHELKTPLTAFHLQLQLMARRLAKEEIIPGSAIERLARGVVVCERQSGKLSKLLNELLDLTRIRLGRLSLDHQNCNLFRIAADVVERFRVEAEMSGVKIHFEGDQDIVGVWDPTRIEQVISNLISNGLKYGDRKPITVRVRKNLESGTGAIIVEDSGMGIPAELQEKVFQRFERAITGHSISGLGLGLYISRQIVEAHGGVIRLQSRPNQGSIFTVEIPLLSPGTVHSISEAKSS